MSIKIDVGLDSKNFTKGSKEVQKQADAISSSLNGIAIASAAVFVSFGAGIAGAVAQAGKIEDLTTRFSVLQRSVEAAQKTMKELQDFSSRTPFQLEGIAEAGAQLLAFGTEADNLIPTLQKIGDVAAASGTDIKEISLIFGQVSAAGKLTGERLLQLQERAIPIGPALAKTMGVAESSIRDLVSKGKVDFATFEKAFASLSEKGGAAFEGMEKQSKTLSGRISTLKDNFSLVAADIGKEFLPIAKAVALAITNVLQTIRESEVLKNLARDLLIAGTVLGGLVGTLASGAIAFSALTKAIAIANIALNTTKITVRSLVGATGIGLLVLLVAEIALNWEKVWPRAQLVFTNFVQNTTKLLKGFGNLLFNALKFNPKGILESFNEVTDILTKGFDKIPDVSKDIAKKTTVDPSETQRLLDIAEAKKEEARKKEIDNILEQEGLKQDLRDQFFEENLEKSEEFQEILDEIRNEKNEKAQNQLKRQFALETQAKLEAENKIKSNQRKSDLQFIKDREDFGKTIAVISQVLNNEKVQGAKKASGDLVALQQSESGLLRTIGKAAAIATITFNTAESASNIFKGFSVIPFIGPALGVAGAAAAIAFGGEQIGKVLSAQTGGIVPQINPGSGDRQPSLLEAGELVVPKQDFSSVIDAFVAQRGGGEVDLEDDDEESGPQRIELGFDGDEAANVLTVNQNEQRALGISQEIA